MRRTFLELTQKVAQEMGTIPGAKRPGQAGARPSTVESSDEMESRIVGWVQDAWIDVQNEERAWRWMQTRFDEALTIGKASYAAADLGITRFGGWKLYDDRGVGNFTIYGDVDFGDEGPMYPMEWYAFRSYYQRGVSQSGEPTALAIDDQDVLWVYPVPDAAKAWRMRGVYRKSAQVLTLNADVPECPDDHHDVIVWKALIKADVWDEAPGRLAFFITQFDRSMAALRADQMPRLNFGPPLR